MRKWPAFFSLLSVCVLLTSCSPCSNEKSAKPLDGANQVKAMPVVSAPEPGRKIPGEVLHVSPDGNDADAGSAEKPLATIQKAVDLAVEKPGSQEIVIHAGIYTTGAVVPSRENAPALVIHAAKKTNGEYEDVILDGGQVISNAIPTAGKAGSYSLPLKCNTKVTYSMWEEDTLVRYMSVADRQAVEQVKASYFMTGKELVFHTSDDQPPGSHRLGFARNDSGLRVNRSNVTIQGLRFRHFLLQRSSAGVNVNGENIIIEDCHVWNARRGFGIGDKGKNVRIIRCRTEDVGNGVFSYGVNTIVEDSRFFRRPGAFEVQEYSQDQSGVQCYHPARGGEMRRNLCVGFNLGLFFKCPVSRFIAEFNTVIGGINGGKMGGLGIGCTQWSPESVFRYNVVAGFNNALLGGEADVGIPPRAVVDKNCFWQPKGGDKMIKKLTEKGIGSGNINADPLFVKAAEGDFRLSGESPAAKMGPDEKPIGAFGVDGGEKALLIAPVKWTTGQTARPAVRAALPHIEPGFVKRSGPARAWHVNPESGRDDPDCGTEEHPFCSLQLALNDANAGDRVVLWPGVYFGTNLLNHGGTEKEPIIIESSPKTRSVLDGMKLYDEACLTLRNAPYVVIRGLEIRWFKEVGMRISSSSNVCVEDCVFWNDVWSKGRRIGIGLHAVDSPGLVVDRCVLFAMNDGFSIWRCPSFRITRTTAAGMLHRAARIIDTVSGSVFRNNSFTFTGNTHLDIRASEEEMKTFDCDYNNLAMYVREIASRRPAPEDDIQPEPSDFFRSKQSKGVMSLNGERIFSLREWQEKTGLDKHSIYKHPRYVDPENRDFRLKPDSPNIGAGENGTNIGALGVVEKIK